jgi:tRNA threonylcarbamoyladenosine biosynthesis protein TsaB
MRKTLELLIRCCIGLLHTDPNVDPHLEMDSVARLMVFSMLLIAADTSGKQGSIALAECRAEENGAVIEVVTLTGGAFAAQLVPHIAALLKKHGHSKDDIGALAVATGPGSFTGLRVGLAAVQALGEVLLRPIVAISMLEAVARSSMVDGRVFAALDAGRGDAYVGDYDLRPPVRKHSERLLSREELIAEVLRGEIRIGAVVTPDAALAEMVRTAGISVDLIEYPNASVIARLGWEYLQRGQTTHPELLDANYIRRSDAEIFSKPAL